MEEWPLVVSRAMFMAMIRDSRSLSTVVKVIRYNYVPELLQDYAPKQQASPLKAR